MCTDETRQEVLYLLAFSGQDGPLSNVDLSRAMKVRAGEVGWPGYLVHSPRSIEDLTSRAIDFGYVRRGGPFSLLIDAHGLERLQYIISRYVPVDQRSKILQLTRDFA
jgi:hypothetical protein